MNENYLPYPDDESEDVAPDVATGERLPIAPDEAVRREQEKYGESDLDANRQDQRDVHHGTPDDIV